jgi:hypothetical protein
MEIAKTKICTVLLLCAGIFTVTLTVVGCSSKKQKKETGGDANQQSVESSREPTFGAVRSDKPAPKGLFPVEGMTDISDNPGYFTAKDIPPTADVVRDLDGIIRPILTKLFGATKFVGEGGLDPNRPGGDVILNSMTYVVRRTLTQEEGDTLHKTLTSNGFSTSPRYGSKPVHIRLSGIVMMSLFKSTNSRSYSLGIRIDLNKQTIRVESYQLGSKYDRLM